MVVLATLAGTLPLAEHEKHAGGTVKVVGEVIDTVCYVSHASRGPDHLECGRDCAAKGISLGILEGKTGRVLISMPVDHSSPNEKLLDFIARRVQVEGTVFRRGGLAGIFVQAVREAPGAAATKRNQP